MCNHDEQELARASLAGDTRAFSQLVIRHQDAVYNLAYVLCGNAATAEDMAQETFIRAYKKLHQYRLSESFRNWVLTICANLCRSRYRRWFREKKKREAYALDMSINHNGQNYTTDKNRNDELEHLARALAALPESLRGPIVLKYMEGMSIQEIAEVLEIRLSAAKMRLKRGREKLYQLIKSQKNQGVRR